MKVALFEDAKAGLLGPVVLTRPVFELRVGAFNLRERLEVATGQSSFHVHVRPELVELSIASHPALDPGLPSPSTRLLLVNGRCGGSVAALRALWERVPAGEEAMGDGDDLLVAWVEAGNASTWEEILARANRLPRRDAPEGVRLYERPWQLVHDNGRRICDDFRSLADHAGIARRIFGIHFSEDAPIRAHLEKLPFGDESHAILYPGVHLLAPENVAFGPGARVKSGVVLDAEDGPILLAAGCLIHANASVQGPAYIGPGSVVNPGAKLREGTSLGALCKVGGEVEESVVLDLSNKQHEGFLGHAYVGSWVNLGADTNSSDLKNNYGPVRVDLGEGPIDTGEMFVGPTMGDHAKTGIDTMLTTGAVVGVAANVFGAGFSMKHVPSFGWGGVTGVDEYEWTKAVATARVVMERRKALWTDAHARLLRHVFDHTRSPR